MIVLVYVKIGHVGQYKKDKWKIFMAPRVFERSLRSAVLGLQGATIRKQQPHT